MNKTFAKVVGILCVATICSGLAYAHNNAQARAEVPKAKVQHYVIEEKSFTEVVHSGDTFWNIAEKHFNAENEGTCFEDFMYKIKHLPENKKVFFDEDGNGKVLDVGEKIKFICKVKVAK